MPESGSLAEVQQMRTETKSSFCQHLTVFSVAFNAASLLSPLHRFRDSDLSMDTKPQPQLCCDFLLICQTFGYIWVLWSGNELWGMEKVFLLLPCSGWMCESFQEGLKKKIRQWDGWIIMSSSYLIAVWRQGIFSPFISGESLTVMHEHIYECSGVFHARIPPDATIH